MERGDAIDTIGRTASGTFLFQDAVAGPFFQGPDDDEMQEAPVGLRLTVENGHTWEVVDHPHAPTGKEWADTGI